MRSTYIYKTKTIIKINHNKDVKPTHALNINKKSKDIDIYKYYIKYSIFIFIREIMIKDLIDFVDPRHSAGQLLARSAKDQTACAFIFGRDP